MLLVQLRLHGTFYQDCALFLRSVSSRSLALRPGIRTRSISLDRFHSIESTVDGESQLKELGDAIVDITTPHDGFDYRRDVVVSQNDVRSLLGYICTSNTLQHTSGISHNRMIPRVDRDSGSTIASDARWMTHPSIHQLNQSGSMNGASAGD